MNSGCSLKSRNRDEKRDNILSKQTQEIENINMSEEDEDEDVRNDDDDINSGWVDSIAKILSANKVSKKTIALSRAKKLSATPIVKAKSVGFEIEKEDGAIIEEHVFPKSDKYVKEVVPSNKKPLPCVRVKVNVMKKNYERLLSKIATKGVVQLFNAVKQQQKEINTKLEHAGPMQIKHDRVLKSIDKSTFLNHLMGDKGRSVNISKPVNKNQTNDNVSWNVLKDDFMMESHKMKDWDKQVEMEME